MAEVDYTVARVEDCDTPDARRVNVHVVVPEGTTAEQMESVARDVADWQRRETRYQALWIGFHDHSAYIGWGTPLGRWHDAPGGQWGEAHRVERGDYRHHEGVSNLKAKDWTQRPSDGDVDLWARLMTVGEELGEQMGGGVEAGDATMLAGLSAETGLSESDIEQRARRVAIWLAG